METRILWFSATGNSLHAARVLARELGAGLEPLLVAARRGAAGPGGASPRRIALVFPLYYLGYPKAVADALGDLDLRPEDDVCAVVTRGVPLMGGVLRRLRLDLASRGASLRYGAYLDMPSDDLTLFSVGPEEAARRKLEAADRRLARIAAGIASGAPRLDPEPFAFMAGMRQRAYRARIERSHEMFYADGSCSGCGTCEKLCPLGRIELRDGRPAWMPGCQECEACINLCPRRAIQYRGSGTEAKRRYAHPDLSWKDIAAQRG